MMEKVKDEIFDVITREFPPEENHDQSEQTLANEEPVPRQETSFRAEPTPEQKELSESLEINVFELIPSGTNVCTSVNTINSK